MEHLSVVWTEYLRELNANSFGKKEDSVTVGEGWPTTEIAIEYTNPDHKEIDMMFNFDLISHIWNGTLLGKFTPNIPNLLGLKEIFKRWQNDLRGIGWNTLFWEWSVAERTVRRGSEPISLSVWEQPWS